MADEVTVSQQQHPEAERRVTPDSRALSAVAAASTPVLGHQPQAERERPCHPFFGSCITTGDLMLLYAQTHVSKPTSLRARWPLKVLLDLT